MKIYGTPLLMGGGGGDNATLPPLLDNFVASRDGETITITASKLESSRAEHLAGAVWVYADHIPQKVSDGTKIELTKDEVVDSRSDPSFTLRNLTASTSTQKTVVNIPETDGELHPYIYLTNNYNSSGKGLLIREVLSDTVTPSGRKYEDSIFDTGCNEFKSRLTDAVKGYLAHVNVYAWNEWEGGKNISRDVFLLSQREAGGGSDAQITMLPYFSVQANRIAKNESGTNSNWWCREFSSGGCNYVSSNGVIGITNGTNYLRPAIAVSLDMPLEAIPKSDGSYDFSDSGSDIKKTASWGADTEFYVRQFTYNEKKQYQTMLEGATAYLPIMPDGQELSKLPSKSKVKLGKFNGNPLKWLICRDSVDQSLRLILDGESMDVLGNKMFDNAEPSNPDSDRKQYGNNRYIWSNIHQWLNATNGANQWYTAQHSADAPPNYTNVAGFLHEWTEKEISVLENASWVVTRHSVDGGGTETFQSKIALPSTTEMGLESGTGGSKLDIFNSDGDRVVTGKNYWCRTPYPSKSSSVRNVDTSGTLDYRTAIAAIAGVRPLCKPLSNTIVSAETDSEGCYTIV